MGKAADIKPLPAKFRTWEEKKITDPTGGQIHDPAAITDHQAIDRIIDYLRLTFVAAKPPPSQVFEQVSLTAAEESVEYS